MYLNEYPCDDKIEPEQVKRSPAVEYGYDKKESPYTGCVDNFRVFERTLYACYGKEI